MENHEMWIQILAAWLRSIGATRIKHSGKMLDIHFKYHGHWMVVRRQQYDCDAYGDIVVAPRIIDNSYYNTGLDTAAIDMHNPSFDPLEYFHPLKRIMDGNR